MIRTAWTVFAKETRELFRDRRTMLVLIGIPVLLYPAVFVVLQQFAILSIGDAASVPVVAVSSGLRPDLAAALRRRDRLELRSVARPDLQLRDGSADAAVVSVGADPDSLRATLLFDPAKRRSVVARAELREALDAWSDSVLAARLRAQGLPAAWAQPVVLADSAVTAGAGSALGQASRFLPLLLVIITLLGTFYPALDLGAGEKERGTLEPLLTVPVPRAHLVAGKFATVALVGLIAAGANLASMLLTLRVGLFSLPVGLDISFSAGDVALIFLTLLPLVVLFAGVFLGISARAQSLKEAQSALTPAYMLILIPAMLPAMPGIELTAATAAIPVGGTVLLFSELLAGHARLIPALIAIVSTAMYATAGLVFAAGGLGREETLFGRDDAPEPDRKPLLQRIVRRPRAGRAPALREALGLVIAVAVLYFYGARLLVALLGIRNPLGATVLSEWLLMCLPAVLFLRRTTATPLRALGLNRVPRARSLAAALALAFGGLPVAWLLGWLEIRVLPVPTHLAEVLRQVLHVQGAGQIAWLFAAAALTPAICEELVFRGALLEGSRRELSMTAAVTLNAVIFGGFHLSTETVIRFLPTAWMGVLLALVVWRTRSLWLSMMMHLVYNGTLVYLAVTPGALGGAGVAAAPPPLFLLAGIVLLTCGYLLLRGVNAPLAEVTGLGQPTTAGASAAEV